MGEVEIKCAYTGMVSVRRLKELFNDFNANEHPQDQIEELCEQFKFQGIRHPAVLSRRTGKIIAGHGRVLAAERLGLLEFPVDEQEFHNEAQEYAFLIADNTTQGWSRLNLSKIHRACENWHYSGCMPAGKTVKVGVWEAGKYVGVVIFSYGANNNAAKSFGLTQWEVCELTRVALNVHQTPVSRIIAIALKLLKKQSPGIRVVFSYADKTNQGHHGGIYQANGWTYVGERKTSDKGAYYIIGGKKIHGRSARAKWGSEARFPAGWQHAPSETKHLYVKALDSEYQIKQSSQQYPKRAGSKANVATPDQGVEGGVTPTPALQTGG